MTRNRLSRALRFTALFALCALAVAAAGCGGSASPSNPASSSTSTAPSTTITSTEATPSQPATGTQATTTPAPAPTAGGKLKIKDTKIGTGRAVKAGDTVAIQYTGMLMNGTVFDSGTYTFTIGAGNVIQGWDQGVPGMKLGGQRQLTIPPALAYGESGTPDGRIPPNSTLKFDLKLVSIQ
jgi:FKBP-type peptidyl-prolyl cis-trans isomerase FkpA